jgi:transposase InsO family protein
MVVLFVSERRVCRALGIARSSQRYRKRSKDDEAALTERIVALASKYGRYGYRRITGLLILEGWRVNHKRVERIWRQECLKVSKKQAKRGRLWLNDGSCVRLRPMFKNHVWSYDCVADRTSDGRSLRILNIIDEYSRECLASIVERSITSHTVIDALTELFIERGSPAHIRSDNGPEFTAKSVRMWIERLGSRTAFIEPGSPWENGYIESFNGKMRDELLNLERFDTLLEAKVLTDAWKKEYNEVRPHSSLGYRPPAPEAVLPRRLACPIVSELT